MDSTPKALCSHYPAASWMWCYWHLELLRVYQEKMIQLASQTLGFYDLPTAFYERQSMGDDDDADVHSAEEVWSSTRPHKNEGLSCREGGVKGKDG